MCPRAENKESNVAKYLDPKADVTFKKVFGEHKHLVISFLNALLPLDPGKQVESIEYMTSEMVPETPLGKNSIVDVRCEETGGRDAANARADAVEAKMRQDKLDTARQMKADGLPMETIAKYTGLAAPLIETL